MSTGMTSGTSLLDHCKACKTSCCNDNRFLVTEAEHAAVVASGAQDHFFHVHIPLGKFYVLDYKQGTCNYLLPGGQCSIQDAKPAICKSFPVRAAQGGNGYDVADWCPAKPFLPSDYIEAAKKIVDGRRGQITSEMYFAAMDAYQVRMRPDLLKQQNAQVIAPPHVK